jgi:hypothetical protein
VKRVNEQMSRQAPPLGAGQPVEPLDKEIVDGDGRLRREA